MAKINYNSIQNQENPIILLISSIGILLTLIVSVLGIKLWWFKHRLSFDQTSLQNGTAGGTSPSTVLPTVQRRNKKQKVSKDKRWSYQVPGSYEVHGVFRQKQEDEMDIQRTQELPPIRIRQLSESTPNLMMPPPRTKKRDREEMKEIRENLETMQAKSMENFQEAAVRQQPTPAPASPLPAESSKISFTFEEMENEIKTSGAAETVRTIEPKPAKRLNRSSSAAIATSNNFNQSSSQTALKLGNSQSETEMNKMVEIRPKRFMRPPEVEDLTKIDELDALQEKRPVSYIRYDEVDKHAMDYQYSIDSQSQSQNSSQQQLHDDYEDVSNNNFYEHTTAAGSNYLQDTVEQQKRYLSLEALRNQKVIYAKDLEENELPTPINEKHKGGVDFNSYVDGEDFKLEDFPGSQKKHETTLKEQNFEKITERNITNEAVKIEIQPEKENHTLKQEQLSTEPMIDVLAKEVQSFDNWQPQQYFELPQSRPVSRNSSMLYKSADEQLEFINREQELNSYFPEEQEDFIVMNNQPIQQTRRATGYPSERITTEDLENSSLSEFDPLKNSKRDEESKVKFNLSFDDDDLEENTEKSPMPIRRATGYPRQKPEEFLDDEAFSATNERRPTGFHRPEETDFDGRQVSFHDSFHNNEAKDFDSAIKQRRPTGFHRPEEADFDGKQVSFEESFDDEKETEETVSSNIKQRRPTGFHRPEDVVEDQKQVSFHDSFGNDETKDLDSAIKQRRPTGFHREQEAYFDQKQVSFEESLSDEEHTSDAFDSAIKQRRPTGFPSQEDADFYQKQVSFDDSFGNELETSDYTDSAIKQRRPTGFVRPTEIPNETEKKVNFQITSDTMEQRSENSAISQRRPTGYVSKEELSQFTELETSRVHFDEQQIRKDYKEQSTHNSKIANRRPTGFNRDHITDLWQEEDSPTNADSFEKQWQEMERDIATGDEMAEQIDEEFAKVRHSYEMHEGDFLEAQKQKPTGFGKSIEDDWENFEKLATPTPTTEAKMFQVTFQDAQVNKASTVSILKDSKPAENEEEATIQQTTKKSIKPKPRKSKVTFDYITQEHVIPARVTSSSDEYDQDDDLDDFNMPPPNIPAPPIPRQRSFQYKYDEDDKSTAFSPVVANPSTISLFGTQISAKAEDEAVTEDSWSAIRKHRNLTEEFQQLSLKEQENETSKNAPKAAFRNPMAQMAITKAKEVKREMDGYKARSIKDSKQSRSADRNSKVLLHDDNFEDTEA